MIFMGGGMPQTRRRIEMDKETNLILKLGHHTRLLEVIKQLNKNAKLESYYFTTFSIYQEQNDIRNH